MTTVYTYVLAARGAAKNAEEAARIAAERLVGAAMKINRGDLPVDEGVQLTTFDPGGGGPCEPRSIQVEVEVSASGLPEAQPRDEDD